MITTFANQKGGVGKSTMAINWAAYNIKQGRRTLLIDADPQHTILDWSEVRGDRLPDDLTVIAYPHKGLHKDMLRLSEGYEEVVIDSPPRVTDIVRSALLASDFVVIPCTPSISDFWAAKETIELVEYCQDFKKDLKAVFSLNFKVENTIMVKAALEFIDGLESEIPCLDNQISFRQSFRKAMVKGLTIFEFLEDEKALAEAELWAIELQQFMGY